MTPALPPGFELERPAAPPRPVNRTGPVAQALAGPAEAPPQQPAARAPQAAAQAAQPPIAPPAGAMPPLPPGFELEAPSAVDGIPGAGGLQAPAATLTRAPQREVSPVEQMVGAVETATTLATSLLAQPVAQLRGVFAAFTDPEYGTRAAGNRAEAKARETAQALTYEPRTVAGQQQVQAVGEAGEVLDSIVPMMPMAQGLTMAMNAPPVMRQVGDATRAAGSRVTEGLQGSLKRAETPAPTPGTKPSAGSAGTDVAAQRRERAEGLPVPMTLTKGQAERSFEQQRFERETAKDPELGAELRDKYAEQNERGLANLDVMREQTGAQRQDAEGVGGAVIEALDAKAQRKKTEIREAYDEARTAGELEELVDAAPLVRYLEKNRASARNAGVLGTAEDELVRLGAATRGEDGQLVPGRITINDAEELRKTIGTGGKKDATNSSFAGQMRRIIDNATEGAGGELYKSARKLYADYAGEFSNQGVIRDITSLKKNTTDRTVAAERVFRRAVLSGSAEDLRRLQRSLLDAGDDGRQAWRELQGQAITHLREGAARNVARDIRGNEIMSPAGLDKAVKQLDTDGKLEQLFGTKGAEQLRDLNDLVKDIHTAPPGSVNTSNTASVVGKMLADMAASGAVTGIPVPLLTMGRAAREAIRNRKTRKQVREAVGTENKELLLRKADPASRPFEAEPPAAVPVQAAAAAKPAVPRDTRLDEIDRLREGASPETVKVLDERAKVVEREIKAGQARTARDAEAKQLEATAAKTTDTELRAALIERANKLRSDKIPVGEATELATTPTPPVKAERIPVPDARVLPPEPATGRAPDLPRVPVGRVIEEPSTGEAPRLKPLPIGRVTEQAPPTGEAPLKRVPVADAVEIDEAQWRAAHSFGTLDGDRAKLLARAVEIDKAAAQAAELQHAKSPRAFDRAVERILTKDRDASQSEEADGGGARLQPAQERGAGSGESRAGDGGQGRGVREEGAPAQAEDAARQVAQAFDRATAPVGNPITDKLSARLRRDYAGARREYDELPDTQGGVVLNTDLARELSPDYRGDRTKSADVHEPASGFIKRVYADKLAAPTPPGKERVVQFTAGGTGAGKTTAVGLMGDALGKPEIVFDTNMNTLDSAVQKIEQALAAGRDARIFYVFTDPVQAFRQALGRAARMEAKTGSGRTVPIAEHANTHVGASQVMRQLTERYRDDLRVEIVAFDNSRERGEGKVTPLADLPLVDENGLREQLTQALDQAHRARVVSDAVRAGFLATSSRLRDEGVERGVQPSLQREPAGQGRSGSRGQPPRLILAKPARDEPAAGKAAPAGPTGSSTAVVTERGLRVPVRYRLLDAAQLITSHDDALKPNPAFPPELQPRDRSRDSSEAQIARIENDLKPELLADSQKASDGAPIIGGDGLVESGNARTIALRRAYRSGKADAYREWLADNAERFGLTADQVRAVKQPVLVRERTVDVDRADFARQANESPVSSMSDTEQATADSKLLPDLQQLAANDDGTLNVGRSADFVREFMREVSPNERNALMTGDGRLSQRGMQRIRNAVFAKAYGDADVVSMLTEATDGNVKNILAGLLRAAPAVARVRELSEAGARGAVDFIPDLIDAVRRFSALREDGMTVKQALGQGSLIGGEAPPRVAELMTQLEADSRAPRRVAEAVQRLVDAIDADGDPRQSSMFEPSSIDEMP